MEVELVDEAKNDLRKMDNSVYILFQQHLLILGDSPYQRHLEHGLDFYVKDIKKKKYKIIYTIEEDTDTIWVQRCFDDHKKYEKWYRSYKIKRR